MISLSASARLASGVAGCCAVCCGVGGRVKPVGWGNMAMARPRVRRDFSIVTSDYKINREFRSTELAYNLHTTISIKIIYNIQQIFVFTQGATPEEIVYRYPSLTLADVYATIAFYLNHHSEVEAYLQQRGQQAQEIRALNQAKFDPQGLRARLLARKKEQEAC